MRAPLAFVVLTACTGALPPAGLDRSATEAREEVADPAPLTGAPTEALPEAPAEEVSLVLSRRPFEEDGELGGIVTSYSGGPAEMRFATWEEREETQRLLDEMGARRTAEGMPLAPELTDDEREAADAQLDWADGYERLCRRAERATSDRRRWRLAEDGARIARGVAAEFEGDVFDDVTTIDAERPGHPLERGRARIRIGRYADGTSYGYGWLEVGSHELTTYPDGGVYSLYPDHPLIQALLTHRDGDCVRVTGHVLGGYTTGHVHHDLRSLACGDSFWTRIDRIEDCEPPVGDEGSP